MQAVYWPHTGSDHYGNPTFGEPVQIKCRWEDGSAELKTDNQASLQINATVYVDREMKAEDYLKKGAADENTPADPRGKPDCWKINKFAILPNLKCNENLLVAYL